MSATDNDNSEDLHFVINAMPNFRVESQVLESGIPLLTITGRMMGEAVLASTGDIFDKFSKIQTKLLIDLRNCQFFSSTAFSFLYELALQRHECEKDLIVIGANQQICKVICMMGMEDYFVFCDSLEEALAR